MSDLPLEECPKCKGGLRRLIGSGCGLIFKGSGFYATDYKNKNTLTASKQETSTTAKKEVKEQCSGCDGSSCDKAQKKDD